MPNISAIRLKFNAKRLIVLIVLFASLSLITYHLSLTFAQSPYQKANDDYLNQLKIFGKASNSYTTAKANYLAYQTATSKNQAFEATKEYLVQANFLYTNYLFLVKEFDNTINWQNTSLKKEEEITVIDEELNFLQNHWHKYQNTTTLEQLPLLASELEDQIKNSTNPKINKVMAILEIAKVESSHKKFDQLSQALINFADKRIGKESKSIVNNWQSEISTINENTKNNLDDAKTNLQKIRTDRNNDFQVKKVFTSTNNAKNELKRARGLFAEILRLI